MDSAPSGIQVRTMNRDGFRSGQWADFVSIDHREDGTRTWLVSFPDGKTHVWVADDDDEQSEYEVRNRPLSDEPT